MRKPVEPMEPTPRRVSAVEETDMVVSCAITALGLVLERRGEGRGE